MLNCIFMQLVSDSVKIKQAQNSLLSEKQELTQQLQQVNLSIENLKSKISQNEEQVTFTYPKERLSKSSVVRLLLLVILC